MARDDCLICRLWLSKGRPGLDHWMGRASILWYNYQVILDYKLFCTDQYSLVNRNLYEVGIFRFFPLPIGFPCTFPLQTLITVDNRFLYNIEFVYY